MQKVVVAGSRGFKDYPLLAEYLDALRAEIGDFMVVSGTAAGADQWGERWAEKRGLPVLRMPADWERYGKSAGSLRNRQMAAVADLVVLFWDGRSPGSRDMMAAASLRGVPLRIKRVRM